MPDIANRDRREAVIALLLRRTFGEFREDVLEALGDPPNVDNVPASLWAEIEKQLAREAEDALALAFLLAMAGMGRRFRYTVDPEIAAEVAQDFAADRAGSLAESATSTLREQLHTAARDAAYGQAAGSLTPRQALSELNRRFREITQTSAEAAGITETTGANSAGELWYRTAFEAETGTGMRATWRAEAGACEVCRPLNRAPEPTWRREFPQGPPAHPNCCCWLDFSVV